MFTHIDQNNQPTMVNVAQKDVTYREAQAQALLFLPENIVQLFDGKEIQSKKGPVFQTATIAGTMAVKQTSHLIPFCHPLNIEKCQFEISMIDHSHVQIKNLVGVHHKTGVEMEALTGCSVAALTIYDMCKALSHEIVIKEIKLIKKSGGKSDFSSPL